MECSIDGDGDIEVLMGDRHDGFEVIYTPVALERFLTMGADVLAKAKRAAEATGG